MLTWAERVPGEMRRRRRIKRMIDDPRDNNFLLMIFVDLESGVWCQASHRIQSVSLPGWSWPRVRVRTVKYHRSSDLNHPLQLSLLLLLPHPIHIITSAFRFFSHSIQHHPQLTFHSISSDSLNFASLSFFPKSGWVVSETVFQIGNQEKDIRPGERELLQFTWVVKTFNSHLDQHPQRRCRM